MDDDRTTTATRTAAATTTTTTTTALSSEMRRARDYVTLVKSALGQKSAEYRNFLLILGMYKRRELSPSDVVDRISDLFLRGSVVVDGVSVGDELMAGFDAFLPPEYRMSGSMGGGRGRGNGAGVVGVCDDKEKDEDKEEEKEEEGDCAGVGHEDRAGRLIGAGSRGRENDGEEREDGGDRIRPRRTRTKRPRDDRVGGGTSQQPSRPFPDQRRRGTFGDVDATGDGATSSAYAGSAPIDAAGVDGIASTEVVLSPPFVDPSSDLLHGDFNPVRIAHRGRRDDPVKNDNNDHDAAQRRRQQQKLQQQQPQQQKHADEYYDGVPVDCKLCNGRLDAIAIANNEPVLLCEQRGCNAE
jgi:hypothetical protein